jgi:phosphoglycerate dehydrogenase-like enzyme
MAELTIWTNARLTEAAMAALRTGVAPHRLVIAERVINNVEPSQVDGRLPEADIAFGQPDPIQVTELKRLRWVQLSSAGYARYDREDLRRALSERGAMMSNSSSVYCEPTAEHALGMILAGARQLPAAWANQAGAKVWPAAVIRGQSQVLRGRSVLLVGFGNIGRRLAELLGPLRMEVTAVRRTVRGDEPVAVHPVSEINVLLPRADHVVNILPAGSGNDGFFTAERFGLMKAGAIFYNIGRGATVDHAALRQALVTGHLAGAYLDVTDPEPLPATDALWSMPGCFITPHTAGGYVEEFNDVVGHFLGNLKRFTAGEAVRDRVI